METLSEHPAFDNVIMNNVWANGNEGNIEIPGKKFPLHVSFGTSNWVYRRDYHNLLEDATKNSFHTILEYSGSTQRVMHTLSIPRTFMPNFDPIILIIPTRHGRRTPRALKSIQGLTPREFRSNLEKRLDSTRKFLVYVGKLSIRQGLFRYSRREPIPVRKNSGPAEY